MSLKCRLIAVAVLIANGTFSEVLRVPSEHATIQSAIDATTSGDTVLVDVGVYAEQIALPMRQIFLLGNVEEDSGFYERPVIDPSTMSNPRARRCLTTALSGSVIEDFVFRNGPAMYPRGPFDIGGVHHFDSAGVFRRCIWDSTYVGVRSETALRLENCEFKNCNWVCVDVTSNALLATETRFTGSAGGWAVVEFGAGTFLLSCSFKIWGAGRKILGLGDSIRVSNCDFGYFGFSSVPIVEIRGSACLVDSCVFHDCDVTSSLVYLSSPCIAPSEIRHCDFYNNYKSRMWSPPNRPQLIAVSEGDTWDCFGVRVFSNTFRDARMDHGSTAMIVNGRVLVEGNRIANTMGQRELAAILCDGTGSLVRNNLIYGNDFALGVGIGGWADARENWWGDRTGPYHTWLNPDGLGDEVGDNVDFDPWRTDTLFMTYVHEPRPPLPEKATLLAYPNPFNSVATIQLTLPRSGIARIELFDITGRKVKELWSGAVGETRDVQFNASGFASGIYFVRAWDPLGNRLYAATKVVLLK